MEMALHVSELILLRPTDGYPIMPAEMDKGRPPVVRANGQLGLLSKGSKRRYGQ